MSSKFIKEYKERRDFYIEFERGLNSLLRELLDQYSISYHKPMQSRTKEVWSFEEKIQRKTYTNPLQEITDLVGLRIVVFHPEEVVNVEAMIREQFLVDETKSADKRSLMNKDQFSYGATHLIVSIDENRDSLVEWTRFKNIQVEFQIQTLCEYVWASFQRNIEYKKDNPSIILSRRLSRLCALFELADDEFEAIRNSALKDMKERSISIESIRFYMTNSPDVRTLVSKFTRIGASELSFEDSLEYITELLWACEKVGIKKIHELEQMIIEEIREEALLSAFQRNGRPNIKVAPILLTLFILYNKYERFSSRSLARKGWHGIERAIMIDRVQE